MLTQAELKQLLTYDEVTGHLFWTARGLHLFSHTPRLSATQNAVRWNGRFAGKMAGSVNGSGYITLKLFGRSYKAHRVAFLYMTGEWPPAEVDHIDGNKTNNAWINLREATHPQNQYNRPALRTNRLGIRGVSPSGDGRFKAQLIANGKIVHLSCHNTADEARAAYLNAAEQHHGEFVHKG